MITAQLGAVAVVVDAKHETAARFWEGVGFIRTTAEPLRLYLPIASIPIS